MSKCKHSGDLGDDYCWGCDGEYIDFNGNKVLMTSCPAFEANSSEDEESSAK